MKKIGIYKIKSPSGKVYIGSSKDIEARWKAYKSLKCKSQVKLHRSFLKHGVDSHDFSVVIECEENELYQYERLYGEYYNCLGLNGLNLLLPKYNDIKQSFSIEAIEKMKINHPSKKNENWLINVRARLANQAKDQDIIEKIRAKNKGSKRPETSIKNIKAWDSLTDIERESRVNNMRGKKHSEEYKKAMSKRLKGVRLSEGHKLKLSQNSGTKKAVIDILSGVIYSSVISAAKAIEMNHTTLNSKLKGRRKNNTNLKYYEG